MKSKTSLCKLLLTHVGETFWLPLLGNLILDDVVYDHVIFKYHNTTIRVNDDNLDACGNDVVYPSETCHDWEHWDIVHNKKSPRTWSDVVTLKLNYKNPYDMSIDVTGGVTKNDNEGWTRRNTHIELSTLALCKIKALIEISYGGNIKTSEWKQKSISKYVITPMVSEITNEIYFSVTKYNSIQFFSHLAFHTYEDAIEFLKYKENENLLKEYFLLNIKEPIIVNPED